MATFEAKNLYVSYEHSKSYASDTSVKHTNKHTRPTSLVSNDGKSAHASVPLKDVSFKLEAGKIYDLLGPSGAGKSMLLRACAKMMEIERGEFFVDGINSRDMTPQMWRRRVLLVPQRAVLIPGTIRDNLLLPWTLKVNYGREAPTDSELESLLNLAMLDVTLDRNAAKLSGGQAGRVALLRAFATKPDVLLLDEVDAALDDESSHAVTLLVKMATDKGASCMRVRHRPPDGAAYSTFRLCDGKLSLAKPETSSSYAKSEEPL